MLSLSISLLIPGWLLSRVFLHWTASTAMAYGAGYGILMLLGTLGTVAAGISLVERGYVSADSGEGYRA
jgi:multidrug transporter EmrE-like cation transporter